MRRWAHTFLFLACLALAGCATASKKPWHGSDMETGQILSRVLKQGKAVKLAILGRAVAEMTRQELDYFDLKKERWEESRTQQENSGFVNHFERQLGEFKTFEILKSDVLDAIVLGRKFESPGRPLEQEAVEIANFARASHLAYWTLTRIPYGQYKILDKLTIKLIEIPAGRTLSIEAFQEVKK